MSKLFESHLPEQEGLDEKIPELVSLEDSKNKESLAVEVTTSHQLQEVADNLQLGVEQPEVVASYLQNVRDLILEEDISFTAGFSLSSLTQQQVDELDEDTIGNIVDLSSYLSDESRKNENLPYMLSNLQVILSLYLAYFPDSNDRKGISSLTGLAQQIEAQEQIRKSVDTLRQDTVLTSGKRRLTDRELQDDKFQKTLYILIAEDPGSFFRQLDPTCPLVQSIEQHILTKNKAKTSLTLLEKIYRTYAFDLLQPIIDPATGLIEEKFINPFAENAFLAPLHGEEHDTKIAAFLSTDIGKKLLDSSVLYQRTQVAKPVYKVLGQAETVLHLVNFGQDGGDIQQSTDALEVSHQFETLETYLDPQHADYDQLNTRSMTIGSLAGNLLELNKDLEVDQKPLMFPEEQVELQAAYDTFENTFNKLAEDKQVRESKHTVSRVSALLEANQEKIPLSSDHFSVRDGQPFTYSLTDKQGTFFVYHGDGKQKDTPIQMNNEQQYRARALLQSHEGRLTKKRQQTLLPQTQKLKNVLSSHDTFFKLIREKNLIAQAFINGGVLPEARTAGLGFIDFTSLDDSARGGLARSFSESLINSLTGILPPHPTKEQYVQIMNKLFPMLTDELRQMLGINNRPQVSSILSLLFGVDIHLDMSKFPGADTVIPHYSTAGHLAVQRKKGKYKDFALEVGSVLVGALLTELKPIRALGALGKGAVFYTGQKGTHFLIDRMKEGSVSLAVGKTFDVYETDSYGHPRRDSAGDFQTKSVERVITEQTIHFGTGSILFSRRRQAGQKSFSSVFTQSLTSGRTKGITEVGVEAGVFTVMNALVTHPLQEGVISTWESGGDIGTGVDSWLDGLSLMKSGRYWLDSFMGNAVFIGALRAGGQLPAACNRLRQNVHLDKEQQHSLQKASKLEQNLAVLAEKDGISVLQRDGKTVYQKNGVDIELASEYPEMSKLIHQLYAVYLKIVALQKAMKQRADTGLDQEYTTLVDKYELADPLKKPEQVLVEKLKVARESKNDAMIAKLETVQGKLRDIRAKRRLETIKLQRTKDGIPTERIPTSLDDILSRSGLEKTEREIELNKDLQRRGLPEITDMATLNRLREIHISGEIFGDGEVNNKKSAELDTLLHEMRQKGKITADQQAVLKQVLMDRGYVGVLGGLGVIGKVKQFVTGAKEVKKGYEKAKSHLSRKAMARIEKAKAEKTQQDLEIAKIGIEKDQSLSAQQLLGVEQKEQQLQGSIKLLEYDIQGLNDNILHSKEEEVGLETKKTTEEAKLDELQLLAEQAHLDPQNRQDSIMPTYFKVQWSEILKAESNLKNSRTIMEGEIMNFEATVKERQRLELKLKEEIAEIDRLTAARERALEKIDENKKQERIAQLGFKRDIMQTSLAIKDKELEIDQLHLQKLQLARNEAKTQSEIDKLDEQIAEQQEKIDNAEKEITAKRSLLRYRKRLNGFDKRPIHLPTLTTYKDPEARKTLVSDIIHHFFMNGLKSVGQRAKFTAGDSLFHLLVPEPWDDTLDRLRLSDLRWQMYCMIPRMLRLFGLVGRDNRYAEFTYAWQVARDPWNEWELSPKMKAGATAMQHKIQQFRDAPFNPIPPLLEGGAWLLDGTCSLLGFDPDLKGRLQSVVRDPWVEEKSEKTDDEEEVKPHTPQGDTKGKGEENSGTQKEEKTDSTKKRHLTPKKNESTSPIKKKLKI